MNGAISRQLYAPTSYEQLMHFSSLLVASKGFIPAQYKTKEEVATAIMMGHEVGLPPLTALRSIAVINGRPTLWGDAMLGLVRASGCLQEIDETYDEGAHKAVCCVMRVGDKRPVVREFSARDAATAGLAKKTGPWQQYPRRMAQLRARSYALRDAFPDILQGFEAREIASEQKNEPGELDIRISSQSETSSTSDSGTPIVYAEVSHNDPVAALTLEAVTSTSTSTSTDDQGKPGVDSDGGA